jgi:hypothetical protein
MLAQHRSEFVSPVHGILCQNQIRAGVYMVAPRKDALTKERIVLSLSMFAAGFTILATALHLLMPNMLRLHADGRSEKMEILDAWRGGVYAAAFGSSHVNDGFDPRTFDDELTAMQRRTPSINLGIEGGSQTEQRVLALEFVRHFSTGSEVGQKPCFVLLELNAGANLTLDHLVHPRTINIYDWDTTRFVFALSDDSFSPVRRYGRDAYALVAMGMHYSNVGMLSSYIFKPPINPETLQDEIANGRRGLHGLTGQNDRLSSETQAHLAVHPPVPKPQRLLPGNHRLLGELADASGNKNLHFIYFVMPMYSDLTEYPLFPATIETPHGVEPILSLARPDLYPQLFTPQYWHDGAHLSESGASLASRLLADQLRAWYQANHRTTACGG